MSRVHPLAEECHTICGRQTNMTNSENLNWCVASDMKRETFEERKKTYRSVETALYK